MRNKVCKPTNYESQSSSQCSQPVHNPFAGYRTGCARRMISGSKPQTKSTSASVESRPSEKRTSELAELNFPSATITCDGSSEPAEQADPLEVQMPSMSN